MRHNTCALEIFKMFTTGNHSEGLRYHPVSNGKPLKGLRQGNDVG